MELVKAVKALMDGCEVVKERKILTEPPVEFISNFFPKHPPIFIAAVGHDGEVREFKPDAIGFYLSRSFMNDIACGPMTVVVFIRAFNTQSLKPELGLLLLFEDEYIVADMAEEFEISAIFNLLRERIAGGMKDD